MEDKTKKYLILSAYRAAAVLGIFLVLVVIKQVMPGLIESIDFVWRKNTDITKVLGLLSEAAKELIPF